MNITGFEYNLNSEIKYLDLDSSVSVTVAVVYQFGFNNIFLHIIELAKKVFK